MDLLDEKGNVFGVVNLVDAVVALAVLAVVLVSVGVVLNAGGPATTASGAYATVVFDPQPGGTPPHVEANGTVERRGDGTAYTVTDTYRTITSNGSSVTVAQVAIPDSDGARLRIGGRYGFETDGTRIVGTVRATSNSSTLRTATTRVQVETVLDRKAVDRLERNDTVRVHDETIGSLDSVWAYPRADGREYELRMGVSLRTLRLDGRPLYATRPVQPGRTVPLRFESALFNGTVEAVGQRASPPERRTIVIEWRNVAPERADELTAGLTEHHPGPGATVQNVSTSAATVVVTTSSGELVRSTHPTKRDVTLTVDAPVSLLGGTTYFHGDPLRVGQSVRLDFERTTVEGTVVDYQDS